METVAQGIRPKNDDARWEAVRRRDPDATFFYSVATTGVFCRPTCPARLPRRENVRFHPTPQAAERAGFRACKRCRPTDERARHADAVARACQRIANDEVPPSLEALAADAAMSPFHFHRVFKAVTGVTPKAYASAHRAQKTREALARAASVTEAIYEGGFQASGRFYAEANAMLGMLPHAFRKGGAGTEIVFAVGDCTLGSILVAASVRGVCAILLGDDAEALVHDLERRFPHAELRGGDADFERVVARAVALVEEPGRGLDLPLDVRGTAFQHRVWRALQGVLPGTTISYAQLADAIGAPRAVRAVASACAANAVAVAIPCHRVVRTDGDLSGYRWGIARKRVLLEREAEQGQTATDGPPVSPRPRPRSSTRSSGDR